MNYRLYECTATVNRYSNCSLLVRGNPTAHRPILRLGSGCTLRASSFDKLRMLSMAQDAVGALQILLKSELLPGTAPSYDSESGGKVDRGLDNFTGYGILRVLMKARSDSEVKNMNQTESARRRPGRRSGKEPLGQSAYKVIKGRILERVLQPGEALVEAKLAEELGMSRTPIRDALIKLEQEGLVVSVPNKGTFVESLSPVDVAEIYDIREVIEGLAARLLARRITRGQAEILEDLAEKADDPSATVNDDAAFHSAIVRLSGSQKVAEIVRTHCLQALTYDEHTHRLATDNRTPVIQNSRIPDEHKNIAKTIISGNEEAAEDAIRQHIRYGKSVVARYLLGI